MRLRRENALSLGLVVAALGACANAVPSRAIPASPDALSTSRATQVDARDAGLVVSAEAGARALAETQDSEGRRNLFEEQWKAPAPERFEQVRTVCLPKGRYIVEEQTGPTLDVNVTVGGTSVIEQREFPSDTSMPIEIDGCVDVRVRLLNPLHFSTMSLRVSVRRLRETTQRCDPELFPKDQWSECHFTGRREQELLGARLSQVLASPKDGDGEPRDWLSLVARRTVCFAPGRYRFHSASDDTIKLYVGEELVLDAPPTRRFPVLESKPLSLQGCKPLRVVHTYRAGSSLLELAWAVVGSKEDLEWGKERACNFQCIDQTRCTHGNTLSPDVRGEHLCVPFGRKSRITEYCDDRHPCAQSMCVRSRCWDD